MAALSDREAMAVALRLAKEMDALSQEQLAALLEQLAEGADAAAAVKALQARFGGEFATRLAAAFSKVLGRVVTVPEVRSLKVGDVSLSRKLYRHAEETQAQVLGLVRKHAAGMHQARELAMALYDGYGPEDSTQRPLEGRARAELPKALRALTDDAATRSSLAKLIERGRAQAERLKSAPLRAAYLDAFDAWENDKGREALAKKLDVALKEKNRFFATRIAQAELAKAHQTQVAQDLMKIDDLTVVQVAMSPAHAVIDICDMHARADLFGLGPGLYPKAKAPRPPFHPFCWCRLRPRYSMSTLGAEPVPGAEASFLRGLSEQDAARVMGSRERAQQVIDGSATVEDVFNSGKDAQHRLGRVGDLASHPLAKAQPKAKPNAINAVFEEQKTARAASDWAVSAGLADKADYSGVSPVVANAWNKSMFDHIQEFPALRANQKFIGTGQAQFAAYRDQAIESYVQKLRVINPGVSDAELKSVAGKRIKPLKMSGLAWAHSWDQPNFSGVVVNRKYGSDVDAFHRSLKANVANGFHPPGCDTIRSVVDHEIGHQLDTLLSLRKDAEVLALFDQALSVGMKEQVSTYAAKNIAEFIAECWAESLNNPTPRPTASRIAKIVRSRYESKFPRS